MQHVTSSLDPISIGAKCPTSSDIKIIGGRGYDLRQPIPVKYTAIREQFLNFLKGGFVNTKPVAVWNGSV